MKIRYCNHNGRVIESRWPLGPAFIRISFDLSSLFSMYFLFFSFVTFAAYCAPSECEATCSLACLPRILATGSFRPIATLSFLIILCYRRMTIAVWIVVQVSSIAAYNLEYIGRRSIVVFALR